jgi:hypothetical protein
VVRPGPALLFRSSAGAVLGLDRRPKRWRTPSRSFRPFGLGGAAWRGVAVAGLKPESWLDNGRRRLLPDGPRQLLLEHPAQMEAMVRRPHARDIRRVLSVGRTSTGSRKLIGAAQDCGFFFKKDGLRFVSACCRKEKGRPKIRRPPRDVHWARVSADPTSYGSAHSTIENRGATPGGR